MADQIPSVYLYVNSLNKVAIVALLTKLLSFVNFSWEISHEPFHDAMNLFQTGHVFVAIIS